MIVDIGFASNIEAFPYFYHSTIQQSALFIVFFSFTFLVCTYKFTNEKVNMQILSKPGCKSEAQHNRMSVRIQCNNTFNTHHFVEFRTIIYRYITKLLDGGITHMDIHTF